MILYPQREQKKKGKGEMSFYVSKNTNKHRLDKLTQRVEKQEESIKQLNKRLLKHEMDNGRLTEILRALSEEIDNKEDNKEFNKFKMIVSGVLSFVGSDKMAITYQSVGKYRSEIIKIIGRVCSGQDDK